MPLDWTAVSNGASLLTWTTGVMSVLNALGATISYLQPSIGAQLREARKELDDLQKYASSLNEQERKLIDRKRPMYMATLDQFIKDIGRWLDSAENENRNGQLNTIQRYGPTYFSGVKKSLAVAQQNTREVYNDLLRTSSEVLGIPMPTAANVPSWHNSSYAVKWREQRNSTGIAVSPPTSNSSHANIRDVDAAAAIPVHWQHIEGRSYPLPATRRAVARDGCHADLQARGAPT